MIPVTAAEVEIYSADRVSVEGILLRENKGVQDDFSVFSLIAQVNGGAITEPRNAEGRNQLWGDSSVLPLLHGRGMHTSLVRTSRKKWEV